MAVQTPGPAIRGIAFDSPEESWSVITDAISDAFDNIRRNRSFNPFDSKHAHKHPLNHQDDRFDYSDYDMEGGASLDNDEQSIDSSSRESSIERQVAQESSGDDQTDDGRYEKAASNDHASEYNSSDKEETDYMSFEDSDSSNAPSPPPLPAGVPGGPAHYLYRQTMELLSSHSAWPLVTIKNDLDESIEPVVEYTDELKFSESCGIPLGQFSGCPCIQDACYDEHRRLKALQRIEYGPILECSNWCGCSGDCNNRVVQKKRSIPLIVERVADDNDAYQWAVKAQNFIPTGTFIDQFTGEVIAIDEAQQRRAEYSEEDNDQVVDMVYCVRVPKQDAKFAIDALTYGNVTRFIRHSENANTATHAVLYESSDLFYHRVAFFASKDIQPGEELTVKESNKATGKHQ